MTELEKLRAELSDLIDEERRVCGVIVKLQEHSAALSEKICKLRIKIKEINEIREKENGCNV